MITSQCSQAQGQVGALGCITPARRKGRNCHVLASVTLSLLEQLKAHGHCWLPEGPKHRESPHWSIRHAATIAAREQAGDAFTRALHTAAP